MDVDYLAMEGMPIAFVDALSTRDLLDIVCKIERSGIKNVFNAE